MGRTFTAPHGEIYRAAIRFMHDLERSEQEYRGEVLAIREKLGVPAEYSETTDVERYSLAIQIFVAMTMEAAISFYAVLRFGGENYDDYFRWGPAEERLSRAFDAARISVNRDADIFDVVRRVMASRHRIVHPFSAEFLGEEVASLQQPDRPWPDVSAAAARSAMEDLDAFFEHLRVLDPENSHFFGLV